MKPGNIFLFDDDKIKFDEGVYIVLKINGVIVDVYWPAKHKKENLFMTYLKNHSRSIV